MLVQMCNHYHLRSMHIQTPHRTQVGASWWLSSSFWRVFGDEQEFLFFFFSLFFQAKKKKKKEKRKKEKKKKRKKEKNERSREKLEVDDRTNVFFFIFSLIFFFEILSPRSKIPYLLSLKLKSTPQWVTYLGQHACVHELQSKLRTWTSLDSTPTKNKNDKNGQKWKNLNSSRQSPVPFHYYYTIEEHNITIKNRLLSAEVIT